MNILLIYTFFHFKNYHAFLKYNFNVTTIHTTNLKHINLSNYDIVFSPEIPIKVSDYPNTKFIFGPHFSVFPIKQQMDMIKGNNSIYIQPSDWAADTWKIFNYGIQIKTLPFGVDTDYFNEINIEKTKIFVYFKNRHPIELEYLKHFLNKKYITYRIFSYSDKYDEDEYLNYLQSSKYGIILGRHESQGFAIEEALSCNVPLLVWDCISMNQEYGANYNDIHATSIPYWNHNCGEVFYDKKDLNSTFELFISKLHKYKPREYIVQHLSIEKCKEKFIHVCTF